MSYNNVLADSVARLRNAQLAKLKKAELIYSNLLVGCLNILRDEGYIDSFDIHEPSNGIKLVLVSLKYYGGLGVMNKMRLFTKPGRRVFVKSSKIPRYYNGLGVVILSTSKGIMTGTEASKVGVGGELLFGVY